MSPYPGKNTPQILITKLFLCNEADLAELGFSLLEEVRLPHGVARRASLPSGWHKVRDDQYELRLLDALGRHRGSIVEAVNDPTYEGNGNMYLAHKFSIWSSLGLPDFDELGAVYRVMMETGYGREVLHETAHVDFQSLTTEQRIEVMQRLSTECEAWLDTRFPGWRSPVAYWDTVVDEMLHKP